MADFLVEIHDTHHPVSANLYFEQQRKEARRRSADFLKNRVPKFLGYFERLMSRNAAQRPLSARRKLTLRGPVDVSNHGGLELCIPARDGEVGAQVSAAVRTCMKTCRSGRELPRISLPRGGCRSTTREFSGTTPELDVRLDVAVRQPASLLAGLIAIVGKSGSAGRGRNSAPSIPACIRENLRAA